MTHHDDTAHAEPVTAVAGAPDYEPPRVDPLGSITELTLGSESSSGSDGTFTGSVL